MAIIGAFARIEPGFKQSACRALDAIPSVSTFELESTERVGVLIEAADIDAAHHTLAFIVPETPGIVGATAVFVSTEDELEDADVERTGAKGDQG